MKYSVQERYSGGNWSQVHSFTMQSDDLDEKTKKYWAAIADRQKRLGADCRIVNTETNSTIWSHSSLTPEEWAQQFKEAVKNVCS